MDAGIALGAELSQNLVFVEAGRHLHVEGQQQPRVAGLGGTGMDAVADAADIIDTHGLGTLPAVQRGGMGHQQLQVVVQLGHRADGRARGAHRVRLVDGDGGWHPVDAVHLRTIHPVEKLAGIGREGLDIAPLALGVERVKDQ